MTEQELQSEERAAARMDAPGGCLSSRLVRAVLIAVVVVVVLAAIAVAAVLALRTSRDKPLDVAIYPGARLVNHETLYDGFDHLQYYTDDPFADVEAFYLEREGMDCVRQYRTVEERPGQEPLREGHLSTRCQEDRSGYGITQVATVLIQPVYLDEQPTDQVVIDIQRYWGE
ncbi:MAG: hypothetical protein AB1435_00515 [Chloroflexota bacterium]